VSARHTSITQGSYHALEVMNVQIRLRSSQIATADNCRRMLLYQYVLKVESIAVSANLAFGRCLDEATREYLRSLTLGQPLPDPVADFQRRWARETSSNVLVFSATQSPETFERMGVDLLQALPESWDATGFEVAVNAEGVPLLDVSLSHCLGRHMDFELYLDGTLDVLVYTDEGDLAYVDVKSATAAHTPLYALRSDQLTSYQVLVEANGPKLGLPPLRRLGFWDFLKRRASSRVEAPLLVPLRSREELKEFRQKCIWLAEDIRRGRFPKASRMQFNTPCEMCDYAQHCVYGDEDGLVFPASSTKQTA
jgi:hypothetical protein